MIEVEIKIKIGEEEAVEEKLLKQGFRKITQILEIDTYFDNDKQEIRGGDKALRLRETKRIEQADIDFASAKKDSQNIKVEINFKGPKLDQAFASRPEFETQVKDAESMRMILQALGYEKVEPQVVKKRIMYVKENVTACLDHVENLGAFLELEILIDCKSQKEAALAEIRELITLLGYSMDDTTARSYLSQLQGRRED